MGRTYLAANIRRGPRGVRVGKMMKCSWNGKCVHACLLWQRTEGGGRIETYDFPLFLVFHAVFSGELNWNVESVSWMSPKGEAVMSECERPWMLAVWFILSAIYQSSAAAEVFTAHNGELNYISKPWRESTFGGWVRQHLASAKEGNRFFIKIFLLYNCFGNTVMFYERFKNIRQ